MANVCIVVPVLNRPERIVPFIESVSRATTGFRLLFVATGTDRPEIEALARAGADYITPSADRQPGDYARKINAGMRASTEPLIFTGADDLVFSPGWLEAAMAKLADGIGVVGTNDLGNPDVVAGRHATHSIVTRDYALEHGTYDQPGVIYHEGYDHNFCDVEMVQTAIRRRAWAFAADSIVEHVHPSWKKAESDPTYELGKAQWRMDARTWNIRKRRLAAFTRHLEPIEP